MRLAAGFRPDPLGSLQRFSRPPSWILGEGQGKKGKGREERNGREEGKGRVGKEERGKGKGRRDGTTLNKKSLPACIRYYHQNLNVSSLVHVAS